MAYCRKCGRLIDDQAVICTQCGVLVNPYRPQVLVADCPFTGLKVLSFLFPMIGLILYIINKDTTPMSAKAYGKMALIGFCIGMAIGLLIGSVAFASHMRQMICFY
ncbi:MAG TPA: zinc ribbon domain-containing protein [Clostridiales bacterium]|jgi:hypothetical protein|nr:zinc ribbon domain-containing protein [Clostridiales bacterium]HBE12927.1 zinc ribbon domain-containing protein [Clostridiales bacterium]HCG36559.1 zinc ribbon domain-containing protein [Clostridiales bacterium]